MPPSRVGHVGRHKTICRSDLSFGSNRDGFRLRFCNLLLSDVTGREGEQGGFEDGTDERNQNGEDSERYQECHVGG